MFPCNSENMIEKKTWCKWLANQAVSPLNLLRQTDRCTLRNVTSWALISCSTSRMVCERDAISSVSSWICWLITKSFSSPSALRAESLAASCSFKKLWRTSNSSLIRFSVCWVWFWEEMRLVCEQRILTCAPQVYWKWFFIASTFTCSAISSHTNFAFLYSCNLSFNGCSAFFNSSYEVSGKVSTPLSPGSVWQVVGLDGTMQSFQLPRTIHSTVRYKCQLCGSIKMELKTCCLARRSLCWAT